MRPTMRRLINLVTTGPDEQVQSYYGKLLGPALDQTGKIVVNDGDGDGWLTIYRSGCGGLPSSAWSRDLARSELWPMPSWVLRHIRPEHRDELFPSGIPFVEADDAALCDLRIRELERELDRLRSRRNPDAESINKTFSSICAGIEACST